MTSYEDIARVRLVVDNDRYIAPRPPEPVSNLERLFFLVSLCLAVTGAWFFAVVMFSFS